MSRLEKISQNKNARVIHERTKEEREPSRRPKLVPFVILALLLGLGYLLFASGVFNITKTEIVGYSNNPLIEEIITSHCETGFFNKNIILFDSDDLEDAIKGDSGVRSVKIKKIFPDKIKVIIEESSGALVWNTAGDSYLIDERGYVIENNKSESLPQVYDNANIKVSLGERVASPTFIKYIIDVNTNFEPVVGAKIERIIIFDIFSDVHIKSNSSWSVYLDTTKDPVSQLENLAKVLREAKDSGHSKLQYIDMRLDNKVFYR